MSIAICARELCKEFRTEVSYRKTLECGVQRKRKRARARARVSETEKERERAMNIILR